MSIILAPVQWDFLTEITQTQTMDQKIFLLQTAHQRTTYHRQSRRRSSNGFIPRLSGHPGITATLQLLWNRFWRKIMQADTITYINNYHTCAVTRSSRQLPSALLQPLPIPRRTWSHIAIDFITDLQMSQEDTTILTVVDRFSKACWLIPLPKRPTALETFLRTSSLTGLPYLPLGSEQCYSNSLMLTLASHQGTIQSSTSKLNV